MERGWDGRGWLQGGCRGGEDGDIGVELRDDPENRKSSLRDLFVHYYLL